MKTNMAMVIDDSKATRLILGGMLRQLGYDVQEAGNGKEGLVALEKNGGDIAVILVDWNMPEMNGYEFVQAVRGNKNFDSIRLVMVTAETDISRVSQALEAGANEYVMKPFTKEAIHEKLQMLGVVQV
jgi:two-component system chemotaxis response regulator CheY